MLTEFTFFMRKMKTKDGCNAQMTSVLAICVGFFRLTTNLAAQAATYFGGTVHPLQKAHE